MNHCLFISLCLKNCYQFLKRLSSYVTSQKNVTELWFWSRSWSIPTNCFGFRLWLRSLPARQLAGEKDREVVTKITSWIDISCERDENDGKTAVGNILVNDFCYIIGHNNSVNFWIFLILIRSYKIKSHKFKRVSLSIIWVPEAFTFNFLFGLIMLRQLLKSNKYALVACLGLYRRSTTVNPGKL